MSSMLPQTGACCLTDGSCTETDLTTCQGAGGIFTEGGTCDPNCCEQPTPTGGDTCDEASVIEVTVGGPTVTVTGDNSLATSSDCYPLTLSNLWWEAFSISECANVTIDLCCSDPYHLPSWVVLFDECPCTHRILADGLDRGETCPGNNLTMWFDALAPGVYYYPVDASESNNLVGQYQMHIKADPCPDRVCCVGASCSLVNRLECDALSGVFLDMEGACLGQCDLGACCTGPGVCEDNSGGGMDEGSCDILGGVYVPGSRCFARPCSCCPIEGTSNCQLLGPDDIRVAMSDPTVPPNGVTHADDFVPATDTITQICAWGAYLDPSAPNPPGPVGYEQFDCTGQVEDDFRVRIYSDDGGLPGALVAERSVAGGDIARVHEPDTGFEVTFGIPMQAYLLVLDPPIVLPETSVTYWLEIANNTDTLAGQGLPTVNTCYWHWAQASYAGNWYCAGGTDDHTVAGDGYTPGSARSTDLAFCLGDSLGGVDFTGAADTPGACCECGTLTCTDAQRLVDCVAVGGVWDSTNADCASACEDPSGDDCATEAILITEGVHAFDTSCATTDGPAFPGGPSALGADIWFTYYATCTGELIASTCPTGSQYDSWIAIYHDPENPTVCPCPGESLAFQVDHSDEGCNGIADAGGGFLDSIITVSGECWLIRVGGWHNNDPDLASRGRGLLEVACNEVACYPSSPAEAERLSLPGNPISQKIRYLSFTAGDAGQVQAVRVAFVSLPAPYAHWEGVVMWVQQPARYCENAGQKAAPSPSSPPNYGCGSSGGISPVWFWGADLGCDPYFMDWTQYGVVHVYNAGIVPTYASPPGAVDPAQYDIQVIDSTCGMELEDNYSDPLVMTMSRWGDVVKDCTTTPCGPPDNSVGIVDVTAVLDKWKNLPGNVSKARADIEGAPSGLFQLPDRAVNITDVVYCLGAFEGFKYPWGKADSEPIANPPGCGGASVCGNTVIEAGEQCDDGNQVPGDGCDVHCQFELCGNGLIDGDEECDDGPDNSDTEPDACRTNCTQAGCGDNVIDSGEECDDGNTTPGDGCDENCLEAPLTGDVFVELRIMGNGPGGSLDPGVTLVDNEMTLPGGGHHVFLEIYISDWDPGMTGLKLKQFQFTIDAAGYSSGLTGTLTPWLAPCTQDEFTEPTDCIAALGSQGTFGNGLPGQCNRPGQPPNTCNPGWSDDTRTDWILRRATGSGWSYLGTWDLSTPNLRSAATLSGSPIASPHIGDMYVGTLVLDVPTNAAGTFTLDLKHGSQHTLLGGENNQFILFSGFEPAVILIDKGQCCNMTARPPVCVDDSVGLSGCLALGSAGGFDVSFDIAKTCSDPCPADCNNNAVPDEDDIASETSNDCDANGIPDECEIPVADGGLCTEDCDPNCNGNSIPDACETDCNDNGIPDDCDIADLTSDDCNGNGIPDECEIPVANGGFCVVDCDPDCNVNQVPDLCEIPISNGGFCTVDCDSDCNGNAIPDACDSQTGNDCDANGIPDECQIPISNGGFCTDECDPDCNENAVPDACDIAECVNDPDCDDCNANWVPDACDIAELASDDCNDDGVPDECAIPVGSGGLCTVGCDPDCNANGVLDECDIACVYDDTCTDPCKDDPTCDDCNLNEVPDWCDIHVSGASQDVNVDEVPDECAMPVTAGDNWTDDIWGLSGGQYPDNEGSAAGLYVTLDGDSLLLDDSVEIQSLRLTNQSSLAVTQTTVGDLTVTTSAGLTIRGGDGTPPSRLTVANDRAIDVSLGKVTIGAGGVYESAIAPGSDGCSGDDMCASLTAGSVTIKKGDCARWLGGGEMTLTEAMAVDVAGDLVLQGSALPLCPTLAAGTGASRGITPPPKLRIGDRATMSVAGNMMLVGTVVDTLNNSEAGVFLGGNFDNRCILWGGVPNQFDWRNGVLTLNGDEPQNFEVAGEDLGQTAVFEDADFGIGTLEVATGAAITFVDAFDNDGSGQAACTEALYVRDLTLRTGSSVTLNNCRVYCETLVQEPDVTVSSVGCGELLELCPTSEAPQVDRLALAGSPISKKIRYLSFTAGDAGHNQAIEVTFQNVPAPYAHWNGTQLWVQEPKRYCENAGQKTVPSPSSPPGYGCGSSGGITPPWFWAADLGCDPHWTDWTQYGTIHVWNEGIIPLGVYDVQVIDERCLLDMEVNFSAPLTMTQSRWADLVRDCTTAPCGPPDDSTGIVDITSVLDKFKNQPGNVSKARADIEGSPSGDDRLPDQAVNITDVTFCLGAFLGQTYPPPGFPAAGNPPSCP